MANLRANKITGTEVFETTGSVQFDGNGDFLSLSSSSDFAFGTGDFTLECLIYAIGTPSDAGIFESRDGSVGATNGFTLTAFSSSVIRIFSGSALISSSATDYVNKWTHLAVTRYSGTLNLFINGISQGVSNASLNMTNNDCIIGGGRYAGNSSVSSSFNGHISNLRVLKGTALYTKNFTPPTRELTVIPNTVLLCCQSTTRANEERTGKTITVNGNAVANELTPGLLTDRIRSGGSSSISGSVEFDGDGDYLTAGTSNDYIFGTGDYTLECWAYFSTLNSENSLVSTHNGDANWTWKVVSNKLRIYTGTTDVDGTSTITTGSWFHFAVSRQSSTLRLFVNGINETTTTSSNNYTINNILHIGAQQNNLAGTYLKGFISNLRVLKGTALYTQNFIPPTRELKNLPGTVLLCCQNSKSATQEATGKTITVNGNATARYFTPPVGFDGFVNFDGATKIKSPNYFYLPTGTTEDRGRGRGVFGGGDPGATNNISFIEIQSTGNAQDFGDLTVARLGPGGFSSSTRGVFSNGFPNTNTIDYITISTTSNAVDFGDSTEAKHEPGACSSSTRGVVGGGVGAAPLTQSNVMDYVTIASTGNAQDFGDLTVARRNITSAQSPTRGIFFGGRVDPASVAQNVIDFITIATTGNALDFGDLTTTRGRAESVSNATRAVCIGGENPTAVTTMEYITISSTGNAVNFGTCSSGANNANNGASNSVRGVFHSAYTSPANTNNLDYITIAATGNTTDFGDLNYAQTRTTAFSDSHGGIS